MKKSIGSVRKLRLLSLLISFVLVLSTFSCASGMLVSAEDVMTVAAAFSAGNGTVDEPYQISSANELLKMVKDGGKSNEVSAYYVLVNDILLNDTTNWSPDDGNTKQYNVWDVSSSLDFVGNFNGQGHTISGLYTKCSGFINTASNDAVISDVNFKDVYVSNDPWVGAVVGIANGLIMSNVTVTNADVKNSSTWGAKTGTLVGLVSDNTTASFTNCAVIKSNANGAITGCADWNFGVQNITNCWAVECSATSMSCTGKNVNTTNCYLITDPATIRGFSAKTAMPALDWQYVWKIGNSDEYPSLCTADMPGAGTAESPYQISNPIQLRKMVMDGGKNAGVSAYYVLASDILLNDTTNWLPDADNTKQYHVWDITSSSEFIGNFNGQGYTISGLYTKCSGFINTASNGTVITNVNFKDVYVSSDPWVGAVIGTGNNITMSYVTVTNASVKNSSTWGAKTGTMVGLISDGTESSFTNCAVIKSDANGVLTGCASWNNGLQNMVNCWAVECSSASMSCAGSGVNPTNCYLITDPATIKGSSAKTAMPALDWSLTWSASEEKGYPSLKAFNAQIWDGSKADMQTAAMSGSGTETAPYEITNGTQLYAAVNDANTENVNFILKSDIYLNDPRQVVIGNVAGLNNWYKADDSIFTGEIDGNGHTVYGLYSNNNLDGGSGWGPNGFVRSLGMGGKLKNIDISHAYLTSKQFNVAGLTGEVVAIPDKTDSYTKAAVISGCSLTNSYVETTESNPAVVGGLVGFIKSDVPAKYQTEEYGSVSKCPVKLDISECYTANNRLKNPADSNSNNCGGIIGYCFKYSDTESDQHRISVTDCYCVGNVPFGGNSSDFFSCGMNISTVNNVYDYDLSENVPSNYTVSSYGDMTGLFHQNSGWYQSENNAPRLIGRTMNFQYPDFNGNGIDEAPTVSALITLRKSLLGIKGYHINNAIGNVNSDSSTDGTVNDLVDIRDLVRLKKYFAQQGSIEFNKKPVLDYNVLLVSAVPDLADANDYSLTWQDEFNSAIDTNNDYDKNWQFQWCQTWADDMQFTRLSDNVTVRKDDNNSYLSMRALKKENGVYETAAPITTCGKMSYLYGYLEIRASVPYGQGISPAFWLKSTNAQYRNDDLGKFVGDTKLGYNNAMSYDTEVDVFEVFGNNSIVPNLHKWSRTSNNSDQINNYTPSATKDISDNQAYSPSVRQWHTYGFEWTPEKISMYVDGKIYNTYDLTKDFNPSTTDIDMSGFTQSPLSIVLNLSLFTDGMIANNQWLANMKAFDGSQYNVGDTVSEFDVDYIRLYQKSNGRLWTK